MKDSVTKAMKRHNLLIAKRDQQLATRDAAEKQLESCIKQRKTLEMLCKAIFQKNHDLYLKHETMLDAEKKLRADLAKDFQDRM